MPTIINVTCRDQTLKLTNMPKVASGGVNEDKVVFSFCPLWDGLTKTAIFYRSTDEVYYMLLNNNECYMPHEVILNPGTIYFGVFGVDANGATKTSEVLSYKVIQGAITENTIPSDPTPDIYAQILALLGQGGIESVEIDANGDLIITLGNGTEINAGHVTGSAGQGVPAGGTAGQVLKKSSSTDYDTEWGADGGIPNGGTTGQVLKKRSNTDGDVEWGEGGGGGSIITASNVAIASSDWQVDTTYADYGYRASITIAGVSLGDIPTVVFGLTEATSGNYAPICEIYVDGTINIYSKVNTAITIPTVYVEVIE